MRKLLIAVVGTAALPVVPAPSTPALVLAGIVVLLTLAGGVLFLIRLRTYRASHTRPVWVSNGLAILAAGTALYVAAAALTVPPITLFHLAGVGVFAVLVAAALLVQARTRPSPARRDTPTHVRPHPSNRGRRMLATRRLHQHHPVVRHG